MSKKIKAILSVLTCLITLIGCQNKLIPAGYLPKPKEVSNSITGSWIKVSTSLDSSPEIKIDLYGELIAFQNDSLYLLTKEDFISLHKSRIKTVSLYLFAPPLKPLYGLLFLIPNVVGALSYSSEFGPYFLLIGAPLFLTSTIMGSIEATGNAILHYPGRTTLEDFYKFARFPQGLPQHLDKKKLHLVIREQE
jgi:hypothetical protein